MKIDITKYYGNRELFYVGELTSRIIHSMQADGEVYLYTKEAKNARANGLIALLDELCAYWNWDKTKITIDTTQQCSWAWTDTVRPANYDPNKSNFDPVLLEQNFITTPNDNKVTYQDPQGYRIILTSFGHPFSYFNPVKDHQAVRDWNGEKSYGMFIGRASASRIYALQKHTEFRYKDQGITSFHTDLKEYNSDAELTTFFCNSGRTYKDVLDLPTPHSDIGQLLTSPITPVNDRGTDWSRVYERIGIEIVCEVGTVDDNFDLSEKIIRPMYFKRPFLLIASKWSLAGLRELGGFKTFDSIFNEGYDQLGEYNFARINEIYRVLEEIISDMTVEVLLERSQDILEHNHNVVMEWVNRHKGVDYHKYINKK